MNKSFKVLWNRFRNSYVVASEATASQGKAGKAAKTVLTAAVVGAVALGGTAFADTITVDRDYVDEQNSTKFIAGNGNDLQIKTDADVRKFVADIKKAWQDFQASGPEGDRNELGLINAIRAALSQTNVEGNAILTGVVGGNNYLDQTTIAKLRSIFTFAGLFNPAYKPTFDAILEELENSEHFTNQSLDIPLEGTSISIGGEGTNPFLIATTGGDRIINMISGDSEAFEGNVMSSVINGSTKITAESGNLLGVTGGSSAINIGGINVMGIVYSFDGGEARTEVTGNSIIELKNSTSSAMVVGAGTAVAMSGKSVSTVGGTSSIVINTAADSAGYTGIHGGLMTGGLAMATAGGVAETSTTNSLLQIDSGIVVGAVGGGTAVTGDITQVFETVTGGLGTLGGLVSLEGENLGGIAKAEVKEKVEVNIGKNATALGIVGGGMAAAQSHYLTKTPEGSEGTIAASNSSVTVKDVTITIGETGAGTALTQDQKKEFFTKLGGVLEQAGGILEGDGGLDDLISYQFLTDVVDAVNQPGVTVGVLGGGMALAYQQNHTVDPVEFATTAKASSKVSSVTIGIKSGYNVVIFGSGLAAASAASVGEDALNAFAKVGSSTIALYGGETIGVMGGGIAYFTGTGEPNTGIGAQAKTDTVNIVVTRDPEAEEGSTEVASVDGIVGGGLAIDDTNPSGADGEPVATKNAYSEVEAVRIEANSGTINKLSFSAFAGKENMRPNNVNATRPEFRDHLDALAYAMEKQSSAIVGGGLASGMRDENAETGGAHVGEVNIILGHTPEEIQEGVEGDVTVGDEVNRANVFGGGIAANGAHSSVGTVNIIVQGKAEINGDIYAGGIAQDGDYQNVSSDYEKSLSTVENATIAIAGGTVNGNIYAGGIVSSASDTEEKLSESKVGTATIILGDAGGEKGAFQGQLIDGTGADEANLTFAIPEYSFKDGQTVKGFDTITSSGKVTGVDYDFGERTGTKVVGGIVEFKSLTNTNGKTLSVGDAEGVGAVAVNPFGNAVSGLTLKVDNGFLALNSDAETAQKAIASAPSQAKASAYVTGTVDLSDNKLLVGVDSSNANGLFVGSDGLLVADAAGSTKVSGSTNFADGSSIHFVNVDEEQTVTIGSEGQEATVGTTVDNVLFKVAQNGNDYTFTQRNADEMGEVGLGDSDLGFLSDLKNHDNPGADFISDFLDQSNTGVNNGNRGQQINAAMNLATAAGVQTAAIDGTMMGIEAANKRASIINNFVNGGVLFAEVSGKHSEVGGGSGFGEIEYDLGGLVVGGEYTTNDWTFGALANLGTGSVDGKGDNSKVENDVDYYGLQAYVGKRFGQFNLVGQVGYLMSENDISHSMIGSNTADVDADVWTIGVRGEVRFDVTENSRVVPYVGVNYLRVSTDGYRTSQGVKVDDIDQNLWTTPIGVKYSGDLKTASGWVWTPSVDVAYIPAFGDDEVDATTDVGAIGHTTMDVWSNSVGRMKLGITANKGNFGFGLEAGAAAGSDDLTEYFGQLRVDYRF